MFDHCKHYLIVYPLTVTIMVPRVDGRHSKKYKTVEVIGNYLKKYFFNFFVMMMVSMHNFKYVLLVIEYRALCLWHLTVKLVI